MNEDYLWDKTGEDPEIEKLENALAVFRYKETAPPELPAKVLPFKKKETPRSFVRYAYAAAACALFAAISFGVLLHNSNNKIGEAAEVTAIYTPQNNFDSPTATFLPLIEKSRAPKEEVKPNIVKIKKAVAPKALQNKLLARNVKQAKPDELTTEEKYAYNQLMLALSITGSKLRLVSDKIEGMEKQDAVNKDGQ
ncbi:MAG: hypothetical protein ABWZ66_09470 [Pyrinomonadaceae bacterium]